MCSVNDVIFLSSFPEFALERIQKRNREEEKSVDLSYLRNLSALYSAWLANIGQMVQTVDANCDFNEVVKQVEEIIKVLIES
jgi:thymidylate kinase